MKKIKKFQVKVETWFDIYVDEDKTNEEVIQDIKDADDLSDLYSNGYDFSPASNGDGDLCDGEAIWVQFEDDTTDFLTR